MVKSSTTQSFEDDHSVDVVHLGPEWPGGKPATIEDLEAFLVDDPAEDDPL